MERKFEVAHLAKHLNEIERIIEAAGTVTLTRGGQPFGRITSDVDRTFPPNCEPRKFGILKGQLGKAPDFDTPMDDDEASRWE